MHGREGALAVGVEARRRVRGDHEREYAAALGGFAGSGDGHGRNTENGKKPTAVKFHGVLPILKDEGYSINSNHADADARGIAYAGQFNFRSASPPTALALPLKWGLRHVPPGSSAVRLHQSRGGAEGV